jgi:hypothetical protein
MDRINVDPETGAYTGLADESFSPVIGGGSVGDAVEQLFSDAQLDAKIGASGFALKLQSSTANVHKRAEGILRAERKLPASATTATAEPTTPTVTSDEHLLEKSEKAVSFYLDWLGDQMSKTAKSSEEIIGQWKTEFPDARPEIVEAMHEAARILAA